MTIIGAVIGAVISYLLTRRRADPFKVVDIETKKIIRRIENLRVGIRNEVMAASYGKTALHTWAPHQKYKQWLALSLALRRFQNFVDKTRHHIEKNNTALAEYRIEKMELIYKSWGSGEIYEKDTEYLIKIFIDNISKKALDYKNEKVFIQTVPIHTYFTQITIENEWYAIYLKLLEHLKTAWEFSTRERLEKIRLFLIRYFYEISEMAWRLEDTDKKALPRNKKSRFFEDEIRLLGELYTSSNSFVEVKSELLSLIWKLGITGVEKEWLDCVGEALEQLRVIGLRECRTWSGPPMGYISMIAEKMIRRKLYTNVRWQHMFKSLLIKDTLEEFGKIYASAGTIKVQDPVHRLLEIGGFCIEQDFLEGANFVLASIKRIAEENQKSGGIELDLIQQEVEIFYKNLPSHAKACVQERVNDLLALFKI